MRGRVQRGLSRHFNPRRIGRIRVQRDYEAHSMTPAMTEFFRSFALVELFPPVPDFTPDAAFIASHRLVDRTSRVWCFRVPAVRASPHAVDARSTFESCIDVG